MIQNQDNNEKPIKVCIVERGVINSQAIKNKIVEHAANSGVILVPSSIPSTIDIETCDVEAGLDFSCLSYYADGRKHVMEKKVYIKDSIKRNFMNKKNKGKRRR